MQGKIPSFDISRLTGVAQRALGLNLFINFYISEDVKDTTRNRMMVRKCLKFYFINFSKKKIDSFNYRKFQKKIRFSRKLKNHFFIRRNGKFLLYEHPRSLIYRILLKSFKSFVQFYVIFDIFIEGIKKRK